MSKTSQGQMRRGRLSHSITWAILLTVMLGLGRLCVYLDVGLWPKAYTYPTSYSTSHSTPRAPLRVEHRLAGKATEAYVTFLAPPHSHTSVHPTEAEKEEEEEGEEEEDGYFASVRMLLYAIQFEPYTRDPATSPRRTAAAAAAAGEEGAAKRDVVVLAQTGVSQSRIRQLEHEGAIVIPVQPLHFPTVTEPGDERWRDALSKLHAFNLTQYTRLLLLDADLWIVRPIHGIWAETPANQEDKGLMALGDGHSHRLHPIPMPNDPPFNAGFMLLYPPTDLFGELLRFAREGEWDHGWMDQGLLNRFFDRDGPNHWTPMDHMLVRVGFHPSSTER